MPFAALTLAMVFSPGDHPSGDRPSFWLSIVPSHLGASILLLAATALVVWWICWLYVNRVWTLSGIVTVDGLLLPNFRINAHQGTAPSYKWQLQQECTQGVYVVYGIPPKESVVVEFTWGTADSCKVTVTLDSKKPRSLFDVEVSLELENVTVDPITGKISWAFKKPTGSPAPTGFEANAMKYHYSVYRVYTGTNTGTQTYSSAVTQWPSPSAATDPWKVEYADPRYARSSAGETWSVEVYVDGFPEGKKTTKTRI